MKCVAEKIAKEKLKNIPVIALTLELFLVRCACLLFPPMLWRLFLESCLNFLQNC
jgi:hypothetical protein